MIKYIGMDAHSSTCSFCVMDEKGRELDNTTLETNGRLIINYLKSFDGKKKLTFEECELSNWLFEITRVCVDEVLVCNPIYNLEYKRKKTDKLDAKKLAKLLRGDFLTPVYHQASDRSKLRDLMAGYKDLVEDSIRLKNRYKSLFRKEGKRITGTSLYGDESFLEGIKSRDFKFVGLHSYHLLQEMEHIRLKYLREIKSRCRKFPEIKNLKSIPGIADIRAAHIVAQVIDPSRFESKYKYWSYCALVRHKRASGGKSCGSIKGKGNMTLKCVYKMAGHSVLRGSSGIRKYYDKLISKGVSDKNAYNAVCRKIAAISLAVWRKKEKYDDKILAKQMI